MSAISHVNTEQRWSYATTASLVIAAWLALAVWSLSSYAEWLDHARMDEIAAPLFVRMAVFTLGWTLMVIAMMLPGTLWVVRGLDSKSYPLSRHFCWPIWESGLSLASSAIWVTTCCTK